MPSGKAIRADEAVKNAVFERRSCGTGSKGPRISDWSMTTTAIPGQYLLIRRLLCRPGQLTFYLCWAPQDTPATMTYFITIAGRRWPGRRDLQNGKDMLGWDRPRSAPGTGRAGTPPWPPSPSSAPLAIRNDLGGLPAHTRPDPAPPLAAPSPATTPAMLTCCIPLGDASVPARGGPALPARPRPHQAVRRRDRLAGPPCRAVRRGADQPRPARLRAPLVRPPTVPPGRRPLAPPQRPAARRHISPGDQKKGNTM